MINPEVTMPKWAPGLIMPGVAKCGTTSLYDILVSHPQIMGGLEKEVRYLMDVDETQPRRTDIHKEGPLGWRAQYPDHIGPNPQYWIDATPQYQYQQTAKDVIAKLDPLPLILFIVRKPSDRIYSMYQYAKYHQRSIDFIADFPAFLNAIKGQPSDALSAQTMLYHAWPDSDYKQMFCAWRELVGADKIALVTLEGLIADPAHSMMKIAGFLDIDPNGFDLGQDQQSNATVVTKSRMVRKIGAKLARLLPDNGMTRSLKDRVKSLNSGTVRKDEKADNAPLLQEIDAHFAQSWAWTQSISLNG